MDDATPTGARPLRVLRIVFRVVFAAALVVLLVLIGIKKAPAVLAAMAPASRTTAVAAGPSSTPADTQPDSSVTAAPTISVPTVTLPPSSASGAGGGGTNGGAGTTTATKPASTRPVVTSLTAPNVACPLQPTGAPGATTVPDPEVTVSWSSTGGSKAWFGIQTSDAEAAPYAEEPLTGSVTLNWPCAERQQLYTVTVQGPGGTTSRSITVRNTGAVG